MIKGLFIDAGHGLGPTGGIDNGAAAGGTTERKEVVQMAQDLIARLQSDAAFTGIKIIPIGVSERMMLKDQIAEINAQCKLHGWQKADALVLSIHMNAAGDPAARGIEIWYTKGETASLQFGTCILEQVAATTGLPMRASKTTDVNRWGRLGILDDTIPFGVLLEVGFITSPQDLAAILDPVRRLGFAEGMLRGIRKYLSLPLTSSPVPAPTEFKDVPSLAWYAKDVELCLHEGLFEMSQNGKFHPERPVTRAEVAAIMARHLRNHHGQQ